MADANVKVTLSTEDLECIVSEWLAGELGLPLPVKYTAQWAWSPGKGPVLVSMTVDSVRNVVPIRKGQSGSNV